MRRLVYGIGKLARSIGGLWRQDGMFIYRLEIQILEAIGQIGRAREGEANAFRVMFGNLVHSDGYQVAGVGLIPF